MLARTRVIEEILYLTWLVNVINYNGREDQQQMENVHMLHKFE
jgi:hypothetical protein